LAVVLRTGNRNDFGTARDGVNALLARALLPSGAVELVPSLTLDLSVEARAWSRALPTEAAAAAELFAQASCTVCHTYRGTGTTNFDAPDLTNVGSRRRNVESLYRFIANSGAVGTTSCTGTGVSS